jgi:hypothetical protein
MRLNDDAAAAPTDQRDELAPVRTENLKRIDSAPERLDVSGDDRAALLVPDPVRLAVQVEEPA